MVKILINAYACCPGMGSEQGMGWNWITSLAKTGLVELFVISEGEYREQCERASKGLPIHWYWNPVPQTTRDKCWNQGNWSFYPLYEKWQRKTAEIAREICSKEKMDILHQLNMIGFREPGYLWQVSKETGIPFLWGPVDAKDKFPLTYKEGASLKTKAFLWLKNTISVWQLKHSNRVREAARHASILLGASSNSVRSFKMYMDIDAILMNETGCSLSPAISHGKGEMKGSTCSRGQGNNGSCIKILWVGKMDFRKQLGLAIQSIAEVKNKNVYLHIVGGGDDTPYRSMADSLGVNDCISWHGAVSHEEVQNLMRDCDVLLFTSVAEGTPHVVLEAIANGLPVICHDTCGHGDSVTEDVGIKIPLSNPNQSVKYFAAAILDLYYNREKLSLMSANCAQRAVELSWKNKAMKMVEMYKGVVR